MPEPKITAVLNMNGDFATIRRTVAALAQQTAKDELELIIVTPREFAATVDRAALECLGAHRLIEVDALPSGAYGWAVAIRAARSPIVVLAEDHSYPLPNWAQGLIDAHAAGDYFAVGPAVENGNPATLTSWGNFLLSFVDWYAPDRPTEVISTAGHNSCYRRDELLKDYGDELERWLNPERVMHLHAAARGKKMLLDSRTSVAHVNISRPMAYFGMSYAGGRVFGAARAMEWGIGKKLFYAAMFPLVPLIRLKRLAAQLDSSEKRRNAKFIKAIPMIMLGLTCHAFGEAVGGLFGAGNITQKYTNYELFRRDFVTAKERTWMLDGSA